MTSRQYREWCTTYSRLFPHQNLWRLEIGRRQQQSSILITLCELVSLSFLVKMILGERKTCLDERKACTIFNLHILTLLAESNWYILSEYLEDATSYQFTQVDQRPARWKGSSWSYETRCCWYLWEIETGCCYYAHVKRCSPRAYQTFVRYALHTSKNGHTIIQERHCRVVWVLRVVAWDASNNASDSFKLLFELYWMALKQCDNSRKELLYYLLLILPPEWRDGLAVAILL